MDKNFDDFIANHVDEIRGLCETGDEHVTDFYKSQANLFLDILRLYHQWLNNPGH